MAASLKHIDMFFALTRQMLLGDMGDSTVFGLNYGVLMSLRPGSRRSLNQAVENLCFIHIAGRGVMTTFFAENTNNGLSGFLPYRINETGYTLKNTVQFSRSFMLAVLIRRIISGRIVRSIVKHEPTLVFFVL
jgi:hypothetical protein